MSFEGQTEARTLDTEREELTCSWCGLVYQQIVDTSRLYEPGRHGYCPRCQTLELKPRSATT